MEGCIISCFGIQKYRRKINTAHDNVYDVHCQQKLAMAFAQTVGSH